MQNTRKRTGAWKNREMPSNIQRSKGKSKVTKKQKTRHGLKQKLSGMNKVYGKN